MLRLLLHGRFEDVARTSAAVAGTSARLAKIEQLAELLRRLSPDEARVAVLYLSGELPQGTIGVGWASLRDLPPPAPDPSLDILEVDEILGRIGSAAGPGSQSIRKQALADLFGRTTQVERTFLRFRTALRQTPGAREVDAAAAAVRAAVDRAESPSPVDVRWVAGGAAVALLALLVSRARSGASARRRRSPPAGTGAPSTDPTSPTS